MSELRMIGNLNFSKVITLLRSIFVSAIGFTLAYALFDWSKARIEFVKAVKTNFWGHVVVVEDATVKYWQFFVKFTIYRWNFPRSPMDPVITASYLKLQLSFDACV